MSRQLTGYKMNIAHACSLSIGSHFVPICVIKRKGIQEATSCRDQVKRIFELSPIPPRFGPAVLFLNFIFLRILSPFVYYLPQHCAGLEG